MKSSINILIIKGALLMGSLFFLLDVQGQNRFNLRFNSEYPNTLLTSVIEVENGYVSTGLLGDSLNPNATPMIFTKFDLEGNFLFQKTYGGLNDWQFWASNPDLVFFNDSVLMNSGNTFDSEGIMQSYLMKFTLEGDTIETIRFYSPNLGEPYEQNANLSIARSALSIDGGIFTTNVIFNPGTGNDLYFTKFSENGELLWEYFYSTEQDYDYNSTLIPTNDGGVIVIPRVAIEADTSQYQHFIKLSSNGQIIWEFNTDFDYWTGPVRGAILDDEFLICASAIEFENGEDPIQGVMKIDTLNNLVWHTPIETLDYHLFNRTRRIVKSQDGQYISGGIEYEIVQEPDDSSGTYNYNAFLAKVNSEGDLMWTRRYQYLNLPFEKHRMYDLRAASGGGFIFCGEATDQWPSSEMTDPPYQQGWLVKVDEYGCLVEGCEEFDNYISETVENPCYFKVGPVPTSQFLNIHHGVAIDSGASYKIYDLQGNVIEEFTAPSTPMTLMLNIEDWKSGLYILSLETNNMRLQSTQIFIE